MTDAVTRRLDAERRAGGDVIEIGLVVNGERRDLLVEARRTLSDVIRDDCGLTGTHVGCEHGVCGACTVLVDGEPARSCLMFAGQADGTEITTIEGLAGPDGTLHPIQQAMMDAHGFQCAFCSPGFLMSAVALLAENAEPTTRRDQGGTERQSLPLHRLPVDRRRRRAGRGGHEGERTMSTGRT